jgi:hypothetical protein
MTKLKQDANRKTVEIEFLFLDLETCQRCKDTDASLEAALNTVKSMLASAGVTVLMRKTLVDTEQRAVELGFVSSPTIRVNGKDIALELRESRCDTCADACGCDGEIDCRVWVWQGREYTEAPEPMIVDAILSAVYGGHEQAASKPAAGGLGGTAPENLKRFYVSKAAKQTSASACCAPAEQEACCAPSEKSACCGADVPQGQTNGCGCR